MWVVHLLTLRVILFKNSKSLDDGLKKIQFAFLWSYWVSFQWTQRNSEAWRVSLQFLFKARANLSCEERVGRCFSPRTEITLKKKKQYVSRINLSKIMLQIFCTIIEESSILNSEWSICASTYKTLQGYIGVAHTGDSSSSNSSNAADWLLK